MQEANTVVNEDEELTIPQESELQTQTEEPNEDIGESEDLLPGDKTPPHLLLKAKQEEAERRRVAEAEVERLKAENELLRSSAVPNSEDVFSEEGKVIVDQYVKPLQNQVMTLQEELQIKDIVAKFPQLKDFQEDFNEYRKDFPANKLESAAKLFLSEKGLTGTKRKGLEKPTGGDRNPVPSGTMTAAEVADLRKNNHKKYMDMLQKGLIKIAD